MQTYQLVFDEAARGYREWWFPLGLFLAGLWIVFLRSALRYFDKATADRYFPRWTIPFALLLGFGGSGLMVLETYQPHARLRDALRDGTFQTVEGRVTSVESGDPGAFVITSSDGLTHEYHYSEHHWTPGYRDANPIFRVGQRARVAEVGGLVARLEIATEFR
jgi:hypothetical protein